MSTMHFIFFGGEPLSVPILEKLYEKGFIPTVIVCNPDRPQGRKMEITPPRTKLWAQKYNIKTLQPESLKNDEIKNILIAENADLYIVVSYGKIIPKAILEIPQYGTINVHPSLLPKYRGPAPIIGPIVNGDKETGVTIIQLDELMDHGPILTQKKINLLGTESAQDLEKSLALLGADLLIETLPEFIAGKINPIIQNETDATYCKKIKKEDGLLDPANTEEMKYNTFRAYAQWPRTFFFENGKRIIITDAMLENGIFTIKKVLPEGKKEVTYEAYVRNTNTS